MTLADTSGTVGTSGTARTSGTCRVMGYTVIDFINKLTTAMNNRYNATLFILQQEYIQAYMFTKVLASRIQKQLCLPITRLP